MYETTQLITVGHRQGKKSHLGDKARSFIRLIIPVLAIATTTSLYATPSDLDTSFGVGGKTTVDFGGSGDRISAMAIAPDGKIVAAGAANLDQFSRTGDFALARYDSGTLLVSDMRFDPASVQMGGPLTATFSGTNLTNETYFDIRFRTPRSATDEVVLNWQQGRSARHTVPLGTAPGTWTVTGVRAHQNINDHSSDFAPLSVILTVTP